MRFILPILLAGLASCSAFDPLERPDLWRPAGSNEANLAAMVAHPSDLIIGVDEPGGNGQLAAAAVERLRRDRVKPLPDSGLAKINVTGSPQTPSTAAPAAGGADN